MLVTRSDLEKRLSQLEATVQDPAVGIYGLGSHAWQLKRESINFVGGARAALMQLAHPFVAQAIDEHSKTRSDIQGRFQRTFTNVFAMTFGDRRTAFKSARHVHKIHTRIRGTLEEACGPFASGAAYEANDSASLMWVWATLIDTIVVVRQRFIGPMSPAFLARFYRDTKRFAYLFGLSDGELPADYEGFRAYVAAMVASDTLTVSRQGIEMSRFLLASPSPLLRPVMSWYRAVTAGLLPPRLRQQFKMRWRVGERLVFAATRVVGGSLYRATPRGLRYVPAYMDARQRLTGQVPGRLAGLTYRLAIQGVATRR